MNRVFILIKNILLSYFQIAQTQENQITYRDHRILEHPDKKNQTVKDGQKHLKDHQREVKSMSNMLSNAVEELTIQEQVISLFCNTTPTHTKLKVLIKDVSSK